jgi:hypothetical protein
MIFSAVSFGIASTATTVVAVRLYLAGERERPDR